MKRIAAGLCALIIATSAQAATKYWVPGNVGSFTDGANWSGAAVPASNDTLYINSGTVNMDSYTQYVNGLNLMRTNAPGLTAYFNMNNSTMYLAANSYIGHLTTNSLAVMSLTNSTLNTRTFYVGSTGVGSTNIMNLNGSTVNVGANLIMNGGVVSTLNMDNNSTLNVATNISVGGASGVLATMNIAGGSQVIVGGNQMNLGSGAGGTGVVNLAANSTITLANGIIVGQAASTYGKLNIDGGSVTGVIAYVGNQSSGELNMNGGRLVLSNSLNLGWWNNGETGTLSASNGAVISVGNFTAGVASTSTAEVVLSGADVAFDVAGILTATNGNATFTFNILDTNGVSTITASDIFIDGSDLVINGSISNIVNSVLFVGTNSVAGTFASVLINGADGSSMIAYDLVGPGSISIIPEPATVGMLAVSAIGLILLRRIRRN